MADYATKKDVQDIVDDLAGIIRDFSQQVSNEFEKINSRIGKLEESIDRLTNTLDGFAKRVEDAEHENAARDAQFKRLVTWAEKVSEKTGIPLPTELA